MPPSIQVGAEVEAQCGRCHDATNHKILVVESDKPKRVQCTVCDAPHLYRKPKGPEEPRAKRTGVKRDEKEVAYEKAMKIATEADAVPYVTGQTFEAGQRLEHKSFGEGIVTKVIRPQVMEVTFKTGVRKLAMNR